MKTIITTAFLIFTCSMVFAQTKKADRLFDKWEYDEAAKLYERAVKEDPSSDNYYRLGQCYQKMFRFQEAVDAYDKVNAAGSYNRADFYLNYGLMLKTDERYTEAREAFSKYIGMAPSDPRGKLYMNSCDVVIDDLAKPVGVTVTNLEMNNSDAAFSPAFYDGGIVYAANGSSSDGSKTFAWTGKNFLDLAYAKRGGTDTEFGASSSFNSSEVNNKYHDGPASFSKNSDTVYFNRVSRELKGEKKRTIGAEHSKIYYAIKKDGKWSDAEPFTYNNEAYGMFTPFVSADGSRLYFASDMPGGMGGTDIYCCVRNGNGWSAPVNVGNAVNTIGREQFPSLDSEGNLYFASDGYMGYGALDICVAKLIGGSFQHAEVLKFPLNSASNDFGIVFLESKKSGYVSSDRSGGKGDADIYYFNLERDSIPCDINTVLYVIGYECAPKLKEEVADMHADSIVPVVVVDPGIDQGIDKAQMGIRPIYFDFDKYDIRSDAVKELDNLINLLRAHPEWNVQVNGNADARGTSQYNLDLSQRRADAAAKYLSSKGINASRIRTKASGEGQLQNDCTDGVECSEAQHQLNRRVEFKLSAQKKEVTVR
jgi:outer membrane protein OmpA-like peptidoglycan-associated protein/tetratricopeptide (TPR) repeat protein